MNTQTFRKDALRGLPDSAGVYALCDLDNVPIYIGQATASKDTSIRKRVQRHLTSARSDVIANRQLDVWEIAYVRGWICEDNQTRKVLESQLVDLFDSQSPLVNGTIPNRIGDPLTEVPEAISVQVMTNELIAVRLDPAIRFPRQAETFTQLLDYVLNVYDKAHLRRALRVHHARMTKYLEAFLST
ncbi:GIY-YIG nuclease family protein [Phycisphaeraceae bacterium D3-23]